MVSDLHKCLDRCCAGYDDALDSYLLEATNQGVKMAKNKVRSLDYFKHEVTISARQGAVTTTVRARAQIAVWSNKRQNGPTVRADGQTHRFRDAQVTKSSVTS